jgi:O-Antigen ligase
MALIPFLIAGIALLVAARWPRWGLVTLVALLPLNAFVVLVVGDVLGLSGLPRLTLAAWHDALISGIVFRAVIVAVRQPQAAAGRRRALELLAIAVLVLGAVYVLVAPFLVTALYAYRALYTPVVLLLALLVLARAGQLDALVGRDVARGMLAGGLVAALAVWPQVYLGGFAYLDQYYHDPGETLAPAYVATALAQPRGVGTFNSPNEFGAFLAILIGLLIPYHATRLSGRVRAWLLVAVALALVLSFSRSGWLSAAVIVTVIVMLTVNAIGWHRARTTIAHLPVRVRPFLAQSATMVVLLGAIVASSNAPDFVDRTISGTEPSAGFRGESASQGAMAVAANPMGVGLGMAGPKSTRFGETGATPPLASETWYIAYAMQVGVGGLLLLLCFVATLVRELWRGRHFVWPMLALALLAGVGTGALFIPVIDEATVGIPLFVVAGLAVAVARGEPVGWRDAIARGAPQNREAS